MRVIDKSLASIYDATKVYNIDDIVLFGNKIYSCITNNTTGEFNSDNWEQTYLVDVLESSANSTFINSLAPEYDNTATYAVDDCVLYNKTLYKCIEAIETAEDFDSSKWEKTYISNSFIGNEAAELLWTNPSPTSAYVNQTVSLDLSNYKHIIIKSVTSIDDQTLYNYTIINMDSIGIIGAVNSSNTLRGTRYVAVSNNSIVFGWGNALNTSNDTCGSNNNYAIPIEIYGVSTQII